MSTNARNRTLSRMKTLIAIGSAATSLAATHCSGIGGFETVDPLPGPGGGACADFTSTFTISVRSGRIDPDAGAAADADADAKADAPNGDAGDAGDGGIGDGEDDGGGGNAPPDSGPSTPPPSSQQILFTIAGRPGGFPSSLKGAGASLANVSPPSAVALADVLPSETQLDIYLNVASDTNVFTLEVERASCGTFGGSLETVSFTLRVTMNSSGSVSSISASLAGGTPQDVPFTSP